MAKQALILVVDDAEDNRTVLHFLLQHYNYAVLEAVNGAQAVTQATQHRPDLILMDLSMPVLDGWQATRQIRANEVTSRIPILAITAHDLPEATWREGGFAGFLPKPCELGQLLEAVQRWIPAV